MSALALGAAILLAVRCAPQIAPETLLSFSQLERAFAHLAVHDNTTSEKWSSTDVCVAVSLASDLIARGHSVDLGLMQVKSANLRPLHVTVLDGFNPCASMRAGGTISQGLHTPAAAASTNGSTRSAWRCRVTVNVVMAMLADIWAVGQGKTTPRDWWNPARPQFGGG